MIQKKFLPLLLAFLFVACSNDKPTDKPKVETPKALQEKSSFYGISKRVPDNLVASLYAELLTKDISLQELEKQLDALQESKDDSLSAFRSFQEKNLAYFMSANDHLDLIKDSLVKEKTKALIQEKKDKYARLTAKHQQLLDMIQSRELSIQDLHIVLKIVKTLPVMEKYQQDHLPDSKTLEEFIKQQDATIKQIDTLTK